MTDDTPRWIYRFDNYERAFSLLREAVETMAEREVTQLEKEGIVQRFEYTTELAWKTMKDYLEAEGVVFGQATPKVVVRKAFETRLIEDGQTWMDALDARNAMSHTYHPESFERVVDDVCSRYIGVYKALYETFAERRGRRS